MATYSTNLALTLLTTGEGAGTWGNTTNTNLGTLLEQAISGYVTQGVSTGTDTTLTIPNGATGVARNMYIELTGTGGASTNLVVPANKKLYFIFNNTTGAVTVKASGQTGVSVLAGEKKILVSNGTDIVEATSYLTNIPTSLTLTTLTATSANITTLGSTSANITTLGSTSANITTLTGTTFGTTATTQLRGASAQITTLTSASANITQLQSTSATITTLTSASANITTLTGTTATYTSATVTNLALTSLTLANLNISSANITTLTGTTATYGSATLTNLGSTSANVTTLTGTTFGTTATTQLRGASAQITTLTSTSANITTLTGTNFSATSLTLTNALKVAEGGTGVDSTPTNGQLLIGNGTGFALSTLTAGTGMTITNNAGSITLASAGLPVVTVTSSTAISASAGVNYILTAATTATVTLPASPTISDTIYVTVANDLTTNVIARNGKNIQGLAEDLTLNAPYASAQLRFTNDTKGWVLV